MNFVLTFFAYDQMQAAIVAMLGVSMSPFWFTLEGAIVGAIIGGLATWIGGEGRKTTEMLIDSDG
jgi:membrane protein YqaA with SNARE-associated domain